MPEYLAPGVYVEEITSKLHPIDPTPTSVTAFVGYARQGPDDTALVIYSFNEFERIFGVPRPGDELALAVYSYFTNGGSQAVIVRTTARYADPGNVRFFSIDCGDPALGMLTFTARSSGDWPNTQLTITADRNLLSPSDPPSSFRLQIQNALDSTTESFHVSLDSANDRFIETVVNNSASGSQYFRVRASLPSPLPAPLDLFARQQAVPAAVPEGPSATAELLGDRDTQTGLYALLQSEDVSLLCLPDATRADPANAACPDPNVDAAALYAAAITLCEERGIFLLLDPPVNVTTVQDAAQWISALQPLTSHAAAFFPRIIAVDPMQTVLSGQPPPTRGMPPCGFVAAIFTGTDATRGVWKAPSGIEARLVGALDLTCHLTDNDTGVLNPLALNSLRILPPYGAVVWGSRTHAGASTSNSEWRYIPVRRLGLFLERSIQRGTMWAVFEPNTPDTWSAAAASVNNFLLTLFRSGAFQGAKPEEAFFVHCGLHQTMTQMDVDEGRLILEVGFAPLKPAEFVILRFEQSTVQE